MTVGVYDLLMLDTSVFVHIARNDATGRRLLSEFDLEHRPERPLFSTVSEGEALAMSRWRGWGIEKRDRLRDLFSELVRLDAGLPEIVEAYSELHAASVKNGLNLGENDMWIAATARVTRAIVLTCDSDFRRVPATFARVEYVTTIP